LVVIPCIVIWGLQGMAVGLLIANCVRFVIVGSVGIKKLNQK
jgi:hypothetical protein